LADRILFSTRQPGRIKADLPLEFKGGKRFKKKEELCELPGYRAMEQQLYAIMREEIRASGDEVLAS
jgi:NitT/TauT family transport system ATP-binding protein